MTARKNKYVCCQSSSLAPRVHRNNNNMLQYAEEVEMLTKEQNLTRNTGTYMTSNSPALCLEFLEARPPIMYINILLTGYTQDNDWNIFRTSRLTFSFDSPTYESKLKLIVSKIVGCHRPLMYTIETKAKR